MKINKFWSQKQNTASEGMPYKIIHHKRFVKDNVDILNEEYKPSKIKDKLNNTKFNEFQRSSSSKILGEVSLNAKTMLLKIGKHIKKMKQSIADITKMNGLYLEEKAKKNYNQKSKRTLKKLKLRRNNSEMMAGNKTFNNQFVYLNDKKDSIKKEDYVKNFVYVNDNYRKQLNFAFLKYNPISHLDNLKILVQAEPSIRKDIQKIEKEVEEDVKWKCDVHHFKKKYLNLLARNERSRSLQKKQESLNKTNKEKDNALPKINNKNNKKLIQSQKSVSSIYKQVNIFERMNKKEMAKIQAQKEQTQEEIGHMLNASKEINNLIQNDNINDKIEMFKTDYAKHMYYPQHESAEDENFLEKDYFGDEKKKIVEKIGTVYSFKMNKTVNEKERIFKGRINNENEKFRKKIKDGKRYTMEEFNNYMINNQVKLPDEKNDDSFL